MDLQMGGIVISKRLCNIRSINLNELNPEKRGNLFRHSIKKDKESKVSVAESELLRILKHLEGKDIDETDVDSIISLKIGKNVKKYDYLIERKGYIKLAKYECRYEKEYNPEKGIVKPKKNGGITHREDKSVDTYKSMLTGAGHSRNCKSLFIRTDVVNKMNKILLCGIPENIIYDRPAKWNAYYAMCTTDSDPVKYLPNMVVIDDFEKDVTEYVDEVEEYIADKKKMYRVHNRVKRKVKIKPFDGAGLVTPQCAARWSLELNIRNKKGKRYIPAAFQFRAIPGIKGELFVADIYEFMKDQDVRYIRDIWGKVWDVKKEKIDCILTKSQFKFYNLYSSFSQWKDEFEKERYGYKRTFNISSYAEHPDDLKDVTMLSYQPLQTIEFTDEEIKKLTRYEIELLKRISSDVNEFIKYRGMLSEDNNIDEQSNNVLPDYYKALVECPALFNDKYIYGKIEEDIKKFRNNLLAGKIIVQGNYQTLTPDIVGLMQYAFNMPVNGFLRKGQIYSSYWTSKKCEQVDIIRNPHVNMEHRIGYIRTSEKMEKWYHYQNTGILTSMYDTYLLALGGADADGDHVVCTPNHDIINAVRRELDAGHGRTVVFKPCEQKKADRSVKVNDTAALMKVNKDSFANDIGSVINEISKLWAMDLTDEIRDAIKICSCIGGLVIDFAKTGEKAEIPESIKKKLIRIKKPYFMRYLPQNLNIAAQEENAIHKAVGNGDSKDAIEHLYRFGSIDNGNMNAICKYMELEVNGIGNYFIQSNKEFDFCRLLSESSKIPTIHREIKKLIYSLQDVYQYIGQEKSMEKATGKELEHEYKSRYRYFYDYCKSELLSTNIPVNDLIDIVVTIYYADIRFVSDTKQKDILWNVFGEELVSRCKKEYFIDEEKMNALRARRNKNYNLYKANVIKKMKMKKISIKMLDECFENIVTITIGDRQRVNDLIKLNSRIKPTNKMDACRLYMVLLMVARKTESNKIIKYYNKPNDLTDLSLSKLAGIDRRKIDTLLRWFQQEELIQLSVEPNCNMIIEMLFDEHAGKVWLQSDKYNEICTGIRDYFRK